jgi:hypothetical protein
MCKVERYLQVKRYLTLRVVIRLSQQDQWHLFTMITTVNQARNFIRVFLNKILNMFCLQPLMKWLNLITLDYELLS